jgi:predicted ArsR family transcriptional regulator
MAARETERARHQALAVASRREIVERLAAVPDGLQTAEIAASLGLHVNTVRWHLRVLTEAGLVHHDKRGGARGRPAHVYQLATRSPDNPDEQRLLTEILLAALGSAGPNAEKQAEKAGRLRGRTLVAGGASGKALEQVLLLLERLGFQPRRQRGVTGQRIAMRPCPFGETLAGRSTIVCSAHLGLVRGALEQLGSSLEPAGIEPFARPDACFIHLRQSRRKQPTRLRTR